MDIGMIKQFLENLPGINKEAFNVAWKKHAGIYATVTDLENIKQVTKILDENAIEYINPTTGIPEFPFFAYQPAELTPEKLESIQLWNSKKNTHLMNR